MAQSSDPVAGQIVQLNAARELVLKDAALYPQVVSGVLPIVGPHARVELRRWGADFLAEAFSCPLLSQAQKEPMATAVLQTVRELITVPDQDAAVMKSLVQAMAGAYPPLFRYT